MEFGKMVTRYCSNDEKRQSLLYLRSAYNQNILNNSNEKNYWLLLPLLHVLQKIIPFLIFLAMLIKFISAQQYYLTTHFQTVTHRNGGSLLTHAKKSFKLCYSISKQIYFNASWTFRVLQRTLRKFYHHFE